MDGIMRRQMQDQVSLTRKSRSALQMENNPPYVTRYNYSRYINLSPMGVNKIYHPDGELAVAKVAGLHPFPLIDNRSVKFALLFEVI
jgi:hypothetical protein